MGSGYYVVGLTKIGMQPINYLHNGHDLEEIFFFEFCIFSWSAATSAHFTAGPKSMSAPHFFSIFFALAFSTMYKEIYILNSRRPFSV